MNKIIVFIFFIGLKAFGQFPQITPIDSSWELISDKAQTKVHRKAIPNSKVFAFRADGIIESSIDKVSAVILDMEHKNEWYPDLGEARQTRQLTPESRVEYWRIKTPIATQERDFLLETSAKYDSAQDKLFLSFFSVQDSSDPNPKGQGKVRGRIHEGYYALSPNKLNPKHTDMIFYVHVDPMGSIPTWIVNTFQKGFPMEVILGLRKQVAKPEIKGEERVQKLFADRLNPKTNAEKTIEAKKSSPESNL